MNEHFTLRDVLLYHERKAREAYDRIHDARASRHTRAQYQTENELHNILAEVVRKAMIGGAK